MTFHLWLLGALALYSIFTFYLVFKGNKKSDWLIRIVAIVGVIFILIYGSYLVLSATNFQFYEGMLMVAFSLWGVVAHSYATKHGIMGW